MTIHHACLIIGCINVILSDRFAGFCMVGLLMEVNSLFLHARALLQYCNKRRNIWFKIVSFGNVITNVVFRLGVNYLVWRWMVQETNADKFIFGMYEFGM